MRVRLNDAGQTKQAWPEPSHPHCASSNELAKAHVPIEEYPQSIPNLTAATSNLFDLIQSRGIALYPDAAMRLAVSHAIIAESSRGWRLDKLKQ